jgi:outer membrane protein assembly factor BamB
LYVGDFTGNVHCLDRKTGKQIWKQETQAYMWSNTLVADGKVYFGDTTGTFWILAAGREKKVLNKIVFDAPFHQTPIVADGVMYVATDQRLYAIPFPKK